MRPKLAQGTNRAVRATDIVDANGNALTVDGWSVLGAARAETPGGALLQVWTSGTPGTGQGQATATGRTVALLITPAMSRAWVASRVLIQAFITSPDGTQTERIINQTYDFEEEVIPA